MPKNKSSALHYIFANRLRSAREQSGMSQASLAERAEISPGYVGDLELGNKFPSPFLLERLALVFHTSAYRFLIPLDEEIQPAPRELAYDIGTQIKRAIDDELTDLMARYADGENLKP